MTAAIVRSICSVGTRIDCSQRVALAQRPVAREQLLELLVRGGEDGFVGVGRPDAVAALDLVGVRAGLARQHAGVGAQADDLVA